MPVFDGGGDSSGSSGGSAGSPIVRKFPFAFDTPGLLTGAALYTPTVGDILLDAWIEIDIAWNGTTPFGDIGPFLSHNSGIFGNTWMPILMSDGDATTMSPLGENGLLMGESVSSISAMMALATVMSVVEVPAIDSTPSPASRLVAANALDFASRQAPAKFVTADPIKVVVSQDGTITGADPGSTQGAAVLYLVTATPV